MTYSLIKSYTQAWMVFHIFQLVVINEIVNFYRR